MHRVDSANNDAGKFKNPVVSPPAAGTILQKKYMNSVGEEIIEDITETGIALDVPLAGPNETTFDKQMRQAAYFRTQHTTKGQLRRNSVTVFQLESPSGIEQYIVSNGERVSLATPITNDVSSDNLINSAGADAGGSGSSSTLYYAYVSNSLPAFAPGEVRLSATAPTNGYLGGSGDALHWRFVGLVFLDGSSEVLSSLKDFEATSSSGTESTSSTSYVDTTAIVNIATDGNKDFEIHAYGNVGNTNAGTDTQIAIFRDSTLLLEGGEHVTPAEVGANNAITLVITDTPPIGNVVYKIRFRTVGATTAHITNKSILAKELK